MDRAARTAELVVRGPEPRADLDLLAAAGTEPWSLRAFRELDDALLRLRFDLPDIGDRHGAHDGHDRRGLRRRDDAALAKAATEQRASRARCGCSSAACCAASTTPRAASTRSPTRRSRASRASLLELALGADRFYMLIDSDDKVASRPRVANARLHDDLDRACRASRRGSTASPARTRRCSRAAPRGRSPPRRPTELGIATIAADDIDFDDELRIAIEERASLSPDALTGMEASLRFVGPETLETKIFGRLSAWQNWIFTRANSTGEHGALTLYGRPERPQIPMEEDLESP